MSAIADKVRDAGIVGAGGAGFPAHVKFASAADTVIANGAECEPLLRCDKAVMGDRIDDVLTGLGALAEATAARRVVLALKAHHRDLVKHVRAAARRRLPAAEVFELGNFYPAGDEQVLVNAVTGRVVPEGGIPIQVGVVVHNVVTLSQVARALDGRPVTRRPLTVAGEVARQTTCELPVGAPMSAALALAGGVTAPSWAILEGGPMMGRLVTDPEEPISKKTSGVLVLPLDHPAVARRRAALGHEIRMSRAACCQCRTCTDLCPRHNLGHGLEPHLAMRALITDGIAVTPPPQVTAAFLCVLCGVCEVYACPMGLSPRKVLNQMRQELARAGQANPHRRTDVRPVEMAEARRVPLPRLLARLGVAEYLERAHVVDWSAAPVPWVQIPLASHTGAPARPTVAVGARVREGDLVADIPEGKLGARQHASIDGVVTQVTERAIRIERN